ncbi:MAG: DUF502 domain-containing protein [Planctomycetia bacterium]|nr:DUF502 domain-containing protein [Planctomycetia bacterium]MCC7315506.1 DUF502 domain-containing protein [Planctomycetota bacterium]
MTPPQTPETTVEADIAKNRRSVAPKTIRGRIVAGVLLVIPLGVTAWLLSLLYGSALWVGTHLVNLVSRFVIWAFKLDLPPPAFNPTDVTWYESLIAVVLTLVMLYLLGWLGTNAVGRRMIDLVEHIVERLPFVDTVYPSVKRMVQALSGSGKDGDQGQRVVLIDFPSDNMKALALMTNTIEDASSGQKYATVFVPTTPNPTSGYMELVPIERVTPTDMSVQMGLSTIISGGAAAPPSIHFLERGSLGKPRESQEPAKK